MEEEDSDFEHEPVAAFRFSLLGLTCDVLEAVLQNLQAHHNYRVTNRIFREQAAREIETITEG